MLRTQLYANPNGRFVHDVVLESCRQNGSKTALIDTSCNRRLTFAEYGSLVESLARGLISAGLAPGEVVAIFLPNSWEFLITDSPLLENVKLTRLPALRRVFSTRSFNMQGQSAGCEDFASLLRPTSAKFPDAVQNSQETIAALPYSSGTTGLPKGVMLSHYNLVANVYQVLGPNAAMLTPDDVMLCFLPLYHIYGLPVSLP